MEMRTAGTIVKPLLNLTLLMGLFSASACSLILPFDDENGPIVLDAAPDSSLTEQICSKYEDNDSLNEAHPIEAGSFTAALCPAGDRDHYAFDVAENQDLTIQVTFENGNTPAGDLDLILFSQSGQEIAQQRSTEDEEKMVFSDENALPPETYILEIHGFNEQSTNTYTLTLTLQ